MISRNDGRHAGGALRTAGELRDMDDGALVVPFTDFVLLIEGFDSEAIAFGAYLLSDGRGLEVADADFRPY